MIIETILKVGLYAQFDNMKNLVLLVIGILIGGFTNAQTIGYVGNKSIDNDFLTQIQFVYPEFSFSNDSAEFINRLKKSYLYQIAYAEKARALNLDKDSVAAKNIYNIQKLIEDKYLAVLYLNYFYKQEFDVTKDEVYNYYNQNIYQFVEPGVYSYIWAIITDSSENNLKFVNDKIKELVKSDKNSEKLKKEVSDKYAILVEIDLTVRPNHFLYSRLRNTNKGNIVGPFYENGQLVLLAVLDVIPEKLIPFSQVEEFCRQKTIEEKRAKVLDSLQFQILIEKPIELNEDYFSN